MYVTEYTSTRQQTKKNSQKVYSINLMSRFIPSTRIVSMLLASAKTNPHQNDVRNIKCIGHALTMFRRASVRTASRFRVPMASERGDAFVRTQCAILDCCLRQQCYPRICDAKYGCTRCSKTSQKRASKVLEISRIRNFIGVLFFRHTVRTA